MNGEHALSSSGSNDFNGSIPNHVQVIDLIRVMIHGRTWMPGSKIPAELELCDSCGVSRTVTSMRVARWSITMLCTGETDYDSRSSW
jgi:DNA-binding transcriptional MocR family regulator